MRLSVEEIRKWVNIYNNDITHFDNNKCEYITNICKNIDVDILPNDAGIIGYIFAKDFDCKKKMYVLILYCRPEYRGRYLSYMFRRIEEIAKQEGAVKVVIGDSVSGYKEEKFNNMLEYFGYGKCGYSKEI